VQVPGFLLGRTRLLLAGGAVAVAAVALAVVIPTLTDGSSQPSGSAQGSTPTSTPAVSAGSATAGAPGSLVVLAHQGGWERFPLETLPAFEAAAKAGAAVETDVHWTSDGVAIMVHDDLTTAASDAGPEHPMVCRGGPYTVSKTTWDVLRERCRTLASTSKDGKSYPIPTFDEAMKTIAAVADAEVVVEMKPERPTAAQIREYLGTITKYDLAERTISSSFFPDALSQIQAQAEKDDIDLRYLLMLRPSPDEDLPTPDELSDQGLWGVALRSDIATSGNVAGLHAKKLTVVVWTVNTEEQWNAAKQAQADLVLTDKPNAYQAWLP
jgi:glycerophosphoryl diester phosphodiesterase